MSGMYTIELTEEEVRAAVSMLNDHALWLYDCLQNTDGFSAAELEMYEREHGAATSLVSKLATLAPQLRPQRKKRRR